MNEKELVEKLMPGPELIIEWSRQNAMLPDVVARHTLEHALTTPITRERECLRCGGSGQLGQGLIYLASSPASCPACRDGKVSKTFTIKEAMELLLALSGDN